MENEKSGFTWRVHRNLVEGREAALSGVIEGMGDTVDLVAGRVRELRYDFTDHRVTFYQKPGQARIARQSTGLAVTTIQDAKQLICSAGHNFRLYFDLRKYDVSYWLPRLDPHIPVLNRGAIFCPAGCIATLPPDLLDLLVLPRRALFVRPDSGLKPFTGFTIDSLFVEEWLRGPSPATSTWQAVRDQIAIQVPRIEPERLLCVVPAVPLNPVEWRFWIVDRKVVASTPYSWTEETPTWWAPPARAEAVAQAMAGNAWQPDIAYVVDVAQRLDKDDAEAAFALCEINAASSSGLYAAKFEVLLPALRDALVRENACELSIED